MRYVSGLALIAALSTALSAALPADATAAPFVIHFDDLDEFDEVTTQFPDITFDHALVLTAGTSLNEFETPPRSGSQVVTDNEGPMSIAFATPFVSVGGYFTYGVPLTLEFFDASHQLLATIVSAFTNNFILSGDLGSLPNEFLSFTAPGGISFLTITGSLDGGSFVLDDLTLEANADLQPVPEPSTLLLVLAGGAALARRRRTRTM